MMLALALALTLASWACSEPPSVAVGPTLTEADFSRPWAFRDRVGSGKGMVAVTAGHAGLVALPDFPLTEGKLVLSTRNLVARSSDGLNWTERRIEPDGHYEAIAYGQRTYVIVGGSAIAGSTGKILASVDGQRWTLVHESTALLRQVRFTEAGFVAIGNLGLIVLSKDGQSWTESRDVARGDLSDAAFGQGRFVAVGKAVLVSSDGGNVWTPLTCEALAGCSSPLALKRVVFGNGAFVTTGSHFLRSGDGLTWTEVAEAAGAVAVVGDRFVFLGDDFRLADSRDGAMWTERPAVTNAPTLETCLTATCLLLDRGFLLIPRGP